MAIGRPVKLMWPREEDFTHDQYRPMALIHARAGLDADGNIAGWAYRNVSPSILGQRGVGARRRRATARASKARRRCPTNFGAAVDRVRHAIRRRSRSASGARSARRSTPSRVESMIDELAAAAGQDPYLFRRARLTDPRWLAVLDAAADARPAGARRRAPGRARGIAIGTAFNSIVARGRRGLAASTTGLQRDARLGRHRLLPDGEPGPGRGAAHRRRRARAQRRAVRPPDLRQRRRRRRRTSTTAA